MKEKLLGFDTMNKDIELFDMMLKKYFKNEKIKIFINQYHCILIGGAIRDILNFKQPRDIDLIIYESDNENIKNLIVENKIPYSKNYFSGYRLHLNNMTYDIWSIEEHFLFKEKIYEQKIENLKYTTFLNYDSLIYDIKNKNLDISNYIDCIQKKEIDFVGSKKAILANPNPMLSILKIFAIKEKYNFNLSERVWSYIEKFYYDNIDVFNRHIKSEYERHYGIKIPNELDDYIQKCLVKIKK